MIKTLLKYDYCLAEWFAFTHDRILPGVSFIFLGKISFGILAIYSIILHFLPFKFPSEVVTIAIIFIVVIFVYSFQKKVWRLVKKYELRKEYKSLDKREKRKRNFVGISSCIIVYGGSFYIVVKMIGGYAVN